MAQRRIAIIREAIIDKFSITGGKNCKSLKDWKRTRKLLKTLDKKFKRSSTANNDITWV